MVGTIRALEKRVRALEATIPPKEDLIAFYVTKLMTFNEAKEMLELFREHGEDVPEGFPVAVLFGGLKLAVEDRLPEFRRLSDADIRARKDRLVAILAQDRSINPVERAALFSH